MSEEPPDQPASPATPPEPTPPASPADPTTINPAPPAQPGLISAAPVGWSAPASPSSGPVGWADPAAPPPVPPLSSGATVSWAPVAKAQEVAPGLVFASTASRFVAWFLDGILSAILGYIALILVALVLGAFDTERTTSFIDTLALVSAFTLVNLAYFVFFWSGGRRATPGQRVFKIQVGNAFDGQPLTGGQAFRRWVGLGQFLIVFGAIGDLANLSGLAIIVWEIVLLISTVQSQTKQGLHDRWANSALVRPAEAGSSGAVMACLIIVALLIVIPIFLVFVALILLGSQISDILSRVGTSI